MIWVFDGSFSRLLVIEMVDNLLLSETMKQKLPRSLKHTLMELVDSYEAAEEELDKERKHENIGRIAGVIGLIVLVSSTVSPEKTYAYVGSIGVGISSAVVLFGAWAWISPPSKNKNRPENAVKEIALDKLGELGFERFIINGSIYPKGSNLPLNPKDGDNFE